MRVLNCYEESTRTCEGNRDEMFIPLVEKHKVVFKNISGQLSAIYNGIWLCRVCANVKCLSCLLCRYMHGCIS